MRVHTLIEQLIELVEEGFADLEIVNSNNEDLSDVIVQHTTDEDFILLEFE